MKATRNILIGLMIAIASNAMAQNTAKVVRVWDGDSFNLLVKGEVISTRLANVDAPEMNQAWGKESQKNVSQLILGKDVEFETTGRGKIVIGENVRINRGATICSYSEIKIGKNFISNFIWSKFAG